MNGSPVGELPAPLQQAAGYLRERYDMVGHGRSGSQHAHGVHADFVDWFAIAGPVERVVERFEAIRKLQLDRVSIVPGSADTPLDVRLQSLQLLARHVMGTSL